MRDQRDGAEGGLAEAAFSLIELMVVIGIMIVLGGLLEGLAGSLIGVLMLKAASAAINFELKSSEIFGVTLPEVSFLNLWSVAGLLLLGLIVGGIGSFFALGKFLNV